MVSVLHGRSKKESGSDSRSSLSLLMSGTAPGLFQTEEEKKKEQKEIFNKNIFCSSRDGDVLNANNAFPSSTLQRMSHKK